MIVDIILVAGVGFLSHLVLNCFKWYRDLQTIEPTKDFDSPKDSEYYAIGKQLNNQEEEFIISDDLKDILSISWSAKSREVVDIVYVEK